MTNYKKLQKVTVDTGGNCKLDLYQVPAGEPIKWIGVADGVIVGFTIDDPLLSQGVADEPWYIDTNESHRPNIPHGQIYDDYNDHQTAIDYELLHQIVYYNQMFAKEEKQDRVITFEHEGIAIYNPFFDSTERFEVDPIEEYGEENLKEYIRKYTQEAGA